MEGLPEVGMRHLSRFRVPELAPNALLRTPRVPKPLATVRSRPSSAFLLMRFSNRSCALSATRWGDATLRVKLSTPNLNPSTLNGSADASRTFSEHPLTLSDGNFSLGSAAVGVSPLECTRKTALVRAITGYGGLSSTSSPLRSASLRLILCNR